MLLNSWMKNLQRILLLKLLEKKTNKTPIKFNRGFYLIGLKNELFKLCRKYKVGINPKVPYFL